MQGRRKSEDFEAINDRIAKLVNNGGIQASDTGALARAAGVTERQARVAVGQLRDRKRLLNGCLASSLQTPQARNVDEA
jgi:hypothetical protein